jgi:hypothetical protein
MAGARKDSLATNIRKAARILGAGGKSFSVIDLLGPMGLRTFKENSRIYCALRDGIRRGEYRRTAPGEYALMECGSHTAAFSLRKHGLRTPKRPAGAVQCGAKTPLRVRMWKILRAQRAVSVADIMELTGASETYSREFLITLARMGYVSREKQGALNGPGKVKYRLLRDQLEPPEFDAKSNRLRELRLDKKCRALTAISAAEHAIQEARAIIKGMDYGPE